jgi:adenosylhomocysteinase
VNAVDYHIKDIGLAEEGVERIEWAYREMPVLREIRARFSREKPLKGLRIGCSLHVTTETANLVITLKEGGAEVYLCASNPLSTQDDVAAALVKHWGISVFAVRGEDRETYYAHIREIIKRGLGISMDDGADIITTLHNEFPELAEEVLGGTEETTTGVLRMRSMERDGVLKYPVIAVNDALTKHLFDNRYGTGQSTVDGILRATNLLIAGKRVVVVGYGWCGRGIAMRMKGMGARVVVCEVDPVKALEALMDGFDVAKLEDAIASADLVITATGDKNVVDARHIEAAKDGVVLANAGHFDVEINVEYLREKAESVKRVRGHVEIFRMPWGKEVLLLGEGRLVNLVAAEGHPAAVMDTSFANQALCAEYLWQNRGERRLLPRVYSVPPEVDRRVAELKLKTMGVEIDTLTDEQKRYLSSWREGT